MANDYPMVVVPLEAEDGGGYFAFAPDLPGCISDGPTPQEALASLMDAVGEWLSAQAERGVEAPAPGDANRRALEREEKLYQAMEAALEARKGADEKIQKLERQLAELLALTRDELGRPRVTMADPRSEIGREVRTKH
ncbi:type II toxin-antitoxin system HicB family antitoxin [Tabrizicola sp.]|uniref:type II toxin-antitoxin system HicB family antitoxin n=1 Tax=Tabrizicola sp. TaxID=2005166 RepID=UPI003F2B6E88